MTAQHVSILSLLNGKFDPFWEDVELGVRAASKQKPDFDARYLSPPDPSWDEQRLIRWQIETLEKEADDGARAIAVALLDYARAEFTLQKFVQKNIPIITFDCDGFTDHRLFYVGTNNFAAGQQAGYALATEIDFHGEVAIDTPSLNVTSCKDRIAGFQKAVSRYKDIKAAEVVTGSQSEERMRRRAEQTLAEKPDLRGIFCASGTSGRANGHAVEAADKTGKIKIVSFDALPDIMEMVKRNVIVATVAQRPFVMGFRIVDYLERLAREGVENTLRSIPPSRIVDNGSRMVSKASLDSYRESLVKLGVPTRF